MAEPKINFNNRTFTQIKQELVDLVKNFYPNEYSDFIDSSVGTMLIDVNVGVGNILSVNTDRAFQETQLENAQVRRSLFNIAKNLGYQIQGKRGSATLVDFTVQVPPRGDSPDPDYLPVIETGAQVSSAGQIFETLAPIDFSVGLSSLGVPNRTIIPQTNANGIIINYLVTKRELVTNGQTQVFRFSVNQEATRPFFKLRLPQQNVLEILDVIEVPNTNVTNTPSEADYANTEFKFYEVEYLAQQRVFVEDTSSGTNIATTGESGIKAARWIDITQKFIKEYTPAGFCELTFGGGNGDADAFKDGLLANGFTNQQFLNNYLENTALGVRLKRGSTLFVRYRTGGGIGSNVGANTITTVNNAIVTVSGSRQDQNRRVQRSLTVNNPIPALGGNDGLSIEQLRNVMRYNLARQGRNVTANDYLQRVYGIPSEFGTPFRANAYKLNNKVIIPILGLNSSGKLTNTSNTLLKSNLSEFLSKSRSINDYIEIRDGRIFNLKFEFEIFGNQENRNQIVNNIISTVTNYFDVTNAQMNEDVLLTPLFMEIQNLAGVNNIISTKVFNPINGDYSPNGIEQQLSNNSTREIQLIANTIYSTEDSMFEIKFPNRDINVILKSRNDL